MFDFLKKALRAAQNEQQPVGPQSALEELGLRLDGFAELDPLPFRLRGEGLLFAPPTDAQKIEAYGLVDLGADTQLHRYYFTDDAWLQVKTTDERIDELKYWVFHRTRHPAQQEAFERWLQPGSELGLPTLEYEGKQFTRVWGDGPEWSPPIRFSEAVASERAGEIKYRTTHHTMLFEREVPQADRMEYLLISAELTEGEFCVVFSVGVDITTADLKIA